MNKKADICKKILKYAYKSENLYTISKSMTSIELKKNLLVDKSHQKIFYFLYFDYIVHYPTELLPDSVKIARYALDKWKNLKQYSVMDEIRNQLKTMNR